MMESALALSYSCCTYDGQGPENSPPTTALLRHDTRNGERSIEARDRCDRLPADRSRSTSTSQQFGDFGALVLLPRHLSRHRIASHELLPCNRDCQTRPF